jgi:hypothetical protein
MHRDKEKYVLKTPLFWDINDFGLLVEEAIVCESLGASLWADESIAKGWGECALGVPDLHILRSRQWIGQTGTYRQMAATG